ncbi:MAG: mercury(II) reductase [Thermoleophilaceae bacterium]|nr:mercury(II) reductase [Thermoleophilaceae bacterium]
MSPRSSSSERDYDLIVLGSGGGAFAAAIRARDLDKTVLMVERGITGGTCVNIGCIPSKALLVRSERARQTGRPSLVAALAEKQTLVEKLRQAKYVDLIAGYGIDFRNASGRLIDPHTVSVEGDSVSAEAILIATGARPAIPTISGLDAAGHLTSTTALELSDAPTRLAVLGANAVGLELGQMLGNFGSRVSFLARRGIAPDAEPEIADELRRVLESEGHEILAPAMTTDVSIDGADKVLRGTIDGEPFELCVDEILVATGCAPNIEELGLEDAGVEVNERGEIIVDECQQTSAPSVFAAGDVTTQPRFVYVAAAAGAAAAENALAGGDKQLDFSALPQIIFTTPAIAQAGLTEAQALEAGIECETTTLPLDAVPRALVNGDTRGLLKLVAEVGTGRLVGASILAEGAPDVIQSAVMAIQWGKTAEQLASLWAPYLSMAEGLKLAAQTFHRDVDQLSCCAA